MTISVIVIRLMLRFNLSIYKSSGISRMVKIPIKFMSIETIIRRNFNQPDRKEVQESVAKSVEADPEHFIKKYIQDRRSFGGRYVAADLFKETFDQYCQSKESRNRYNVPVHNSAAVLSAEMFRRRLADNTFVEQDMAVFLTGIPGSGKTSSVLAGGILECYRVIFEGQLSNPQTTREKLQQALDAGLKPLIIVAHTTPENALANTIKRFYEEGRGASINIMSQIQSGLPDSLAEVRQHFGDIIALQVYDYRDRKQPGILTGWDNLEILKSEGNHEQINQRLRYALEQNRATISDECYRQASGAAPGELTRSHGVG